MRHWRFAGVRFMPRHFWVGVYWTETGDRVLICLLPMLPIVLVADEETP